MFRWRWRRVIRRTTRRSIAPRYYVQDFQLEDEEDEAPEDHSDNGQAQLEPKVAEGTLSAKEFVDAVVEVAAGHATVEGGGGGERNGGKQAEARGRLSGGS